MPERKMPCSLPNVPVPPPPPCGNRVHLTEAAGKSMLLYVQDFSGEIEDLRRTVKRLHWVVIGMGAALVLVSVSLAVHLTWGYR